MLLMVFLLFLFLFSGCIISLTSCQKRGSGHAGASRAAEIADEAGRTLSIFNGTIAAAVMIGGSLFIIYCVKRSNKTRRRRKIGKVHRG
jgi:ABC-type Fe3+ transport system permease subunit